MSRNGGDVLTRELLMKSRRPTHGRTVVVVAVVVIGDAYPNPFDEQLNNSIALHTKTPKVHYRSCLVTIGERIQ